MNKGLAALFLWIVLSSLTPAVIKFGLKEIPPITLNFLRFAIAALVITPLFLKYKPTKIPRSDLLTLSIAGLFGTAINSSMYAYGLQFTTTIMAQLIYAVTPLVIGVLGYFFLKENFTKHKVIGLAVSFIGVGLLFYNSLVLGQTNTFGTIFGNVIQVIAMLSWCVYILLSRKLSATYNPIVLAGISFYAGAVGLAFFVPIELLATGRTLTNISQQTVVDILFLGVVASTISYLLQQYGIKKTSAFVASLTMLLAPFAVAFWAVILLGEEITSALILGSLITIGGVFYATVFEGGRKYVKRMLQ